MRYEVLPFLRGLVDAAAEMVRGWPKIEINPTMLVQVKSRLLAPFAMPAVRAQLSGVLIKEGLAPEDWLREAVSFTQSTHGDGFLIPVAVRLSPQDLENRNAPTEQLTAGFPYALISFLFQIATTPPVCGNPILNDIQNLLALKAAANEGVSEDEAVSFRVAFTASPIDISSVLDGLKRKPNGEGPNRPGQYL